jgi:hypothetical protein
MKKAILIILGVTIVLMIATAFIPVSHSEIQGGGCFGVDGKETCMAAYGVGYSGNGMPFTYNIKCEYFSCEGNYGLTAGADSSLDYNYDIIGLIVIPMVLNFLIYLMISIVGYLVWYFATKLTAGKRIKTASKNFS